MPSQQSRVRLLFALLGTFPILLATLHYGIGLSPDSVGYLAAAESLLAGTGLTRWGEPLIVQPPLYPLLLAGLQTLPGIPILHAAALFNALLFGLTLFLAGHLAQRHWGFSRLWLALFLGTLIVARPLFQVNATALSEPLFHFCVIVLLSALLAWRETAARRWILLAAVAAAGAVMTRYIGVTVIGAGAVAILVWRCDTARATRAGNLALFLSIACLPFALWLLRNHALSETWMGPREGSGFSLWVNLAFVAVTLIAWYIPLKETHAFALLKKLAGGSGAAAAGLPIALWAQGRRTGIRFVHTPAFLPAAFVLLYTGLLVYSSTTTGYDQISDRLLAPVHIPLTLLMFAWLNARYPQGQGPGTERKGTLTAILLVFLFMIAAPGFKLGQQVSAFARGGVGAGDDSFGQYNSRMWRENALLDFLREASDTPPLYSNSAPAVWQWTGRITEPLIGAPAPAETWLRHDTAWVAWFTIEFREARDPEEFFDGAEWELIESFEEGSIFRIKN